ncbi:ABC transporter permease [Mycoplasmatota bacterium]|nr:ABC transporter permease [Mycoplasmatota bacterium]
MKFKIKKMNYKQILKYLKPLEQPIVAISFALVIGAIAMLLAKSNPLVVYGYMLKGAFGSKFYLSTTLAKATPIILAGLGASIAWRSNCFGIGGEGQMIVGAFVAAIIAIYLPAPMWIKFVSSIVGGVVAGGGYSLISAYLFDKFQMSLSISTLMMNYAGRFIVLYFIVNFFLDTSSTGGKLQQTYKIPEEIRFPRLNEDYALTIGFFIAVAVVILVWFLMNKTKYGYESKMVGYNLEFCRFGGIKAKKIMYLSLFISGVLSAFAGVSEVYGTYFRYVSGSLVSGRSAWIGLNAALISAYNPIGVLVSSIILAGIQTGGSAISRFTTVPLEISQILQGCITLFISAKIVIKWRRKNTNSKKLNVKGGM